jgi:hypothetical protein
MEFLPYQNMIFQTKLTKASDIYLAVYQTKLESMLDLVGSKS